MTGAVLLALPPMAFSQERVGVVTTLEGSATVARLAVPQAQPLHFKDSVYLHDRITTGERSIVRVLLGGKATVTARERSVVTITEVPGVATIQLGEGRISVAVSKAMMKPGEAVEIKTPNAVTAIRGTVVVAEVSPASDGHRSRITILRGLVEVTKLDATGSLVGPAVKLGALERVAVSTAKPIATPETITPEAAKQLASEFSAIPSSAPAATQDALNTEVKTNSIKEAAQIVGWTTPIVASKMTDPTADPVTTVTNTTTPTTNTTTPTTNTTTPITNTTTPITDTTTPITDTTTLITSAGTSDLLDDGKLKKLKPPKPPKK